MRRCMFYHPYKESWDSGERKQYDNDQQRENWSVNGGSPWNYSRSGGQRIGNN